MEKQSWKILAIVFICLFVAETVYVGWGVALLKADEEKEFECLYNICGENYDVTYDSGVCTCYDLDVMGNYIVSEYTYMN